MKGSKQKTPYSVTRQAFAWEDEPLLGSDLGKLYARLRRQVLDADRPAIEELNAAIQAHPGVPHFRHLLTQHHEMELGDKPNAEIRDDLAREFPDWVLSRVHMAGMALDDEEVETAEELLGPGCELHQLCPDRKIFHEQEAQPYELCAMRIFLGKREIEEAENRLERILAINPDSLVAELAEPIFQFLSQQMEEDDEDFEDEDMEGMEDDEDGLEVFSPEAAAQITLRFQRLLEAQTTAEPAFRLAATKSLYGDELDPGEDVIRSLLSAPRADLIHDLEAVLEDAQARWLAHQSVDEPPQFMVLHALYLLTEVKATESLEKVLGLFSQHPLVLESWLGDVMLDGLWEVLYVLGQDRLDLLVQFAKDQTHDTLIRTVVPDALAAMLLHQPQRRTEVIAALKEIIAAPTHHQLPLSQAQTEALGMAVNSCVAGRATELLPEISRLYAMDLGIEEYAETLKKLKKEIALPANAKAFQPLTGNYQARLEDLGEMLGAW